MATAMADGNVTEMEVAMVDCDRNGNVDGNGNGNGQLQW
jgi:hypothetical protein